MMSWSWWRTLRFVVLSWLGLATENDRHLSHRLGLYEGSLLTLRLLRERGCTQEVMQSLQRSFEKGREDTRARIGDEWGLKQLPETPL
jgi:hypothetical protein